MKLKPCSACGHECDPNAKTCPNCGRSYPTISRLGCLFVVGVIVALMLLFSVFMGENKNDASERRGEEDVPLAAPQPKVTEAACANVTPVVLAAVREDLAAAAAAEKQQNFPLMARHIGIMCDSLEQGAAYLANCGHHVDSRQFDTGAANCWIAHEAVLEGDGEALQRAMNTVDIALQAIIAGQ